MIRMIATKAQINSLDKNLDVLALAGTKDGVDSKAILKARIATLKMQETLDRILFRLLKLGTK